MELKPRQLAAVRALVRGGSISAVARETSTSRHTINRWRKLPAFQSELRRLHEMLAREPRSNAADSAVQAGRGERAPQPPPPAPQVPRAGRTRESKFVTESRAALDRAFDQVLDDFLGRGIPTNISKKSS